MTLKHRFVSGKADGADATVVQPSNWNDDHVFDTIAVAEGATTNPPSTTSTGSSIAYSSVLNAYVYWTGTAWRALNEPRVGVVAFAPYGTYDTARYLPCDGQPRLKSAYPAMGATQADALVYRFIGTNLSNGGGKIIALYANGVTLLGGVVNAGILRSTDNLATLSSVIYPATSQSGYNVSGFAYGTTTGNPGGIFVAVFGATSSTIGAYSTDGGQTWTQSTMPSSTTWLQVLWNGSVFLAISGAFGAIGAVSSDGINWTSAPPPSGGFGYNAGCVSGGLFVINYGSSYYYTSPDGVTWTGRPAPSALVNPNGFNVPLVFSICAAKPNLILAFSPQSAYYYLSSTDGGVTWVTRTFPFGRAAGYDTSGNLVVGVPTAAVYNPNLNTFLVTFAGGPSVQMGCATTVDGINWRTRVLPAQGPVQTPNFGAFAAIQTGWVLSANATYNNLTVAFEPDSTRFEMPLIAHNFVSDAAVPVMRAA